VDLEVRGAWETGVLPSGIENRSPVCWSERGTVRTTVYVARSGCCATPTDQQWVWTVAPGDVGLFGTGSPCWSSDETSPLLDATTQTGDVLAGQHPKGRVQVWPLNRRFHCGDSV